MSDRPNIETAVDAFRYLFDIIDPSHLIFTFGVASHTAYALALDGRRCRWLLDTIALERASGAFDPIRRLGDADAMAKIAEFKKNRAQIQFADPASVMARYTVVELLTTRVGDALRLVATTNGGSCITLWLSDYLVWMLFDAIEHGIKLGLKTE